MANFKKSYEILKRLEFSDHSNALHKNPTENGLTWMGIYEKANPNWSEWKSIKDTLKATGNDIKATSNILYKDAVLQSMTANFYKENYWDKIKADEIVSQKIADEIFLFGVNAGVKTAVIAAQTLMRIKADGIVGSNTLVAINNYDENKFSKEYDRLELEHYNKLIEKNSRLRIYANGWKNRAESV